MSMLEKVALAIINRERLPQGLYPIKFVEMISTKELERGKEFARAALQAIREPDTDMVDAGLWVLPYMQTTPTDVRTSFTAMIDAILQGGE